MLLKIRNVRGKKRSFLEKNMSNWSLPEHLRGKGYPIVCEHPKGKHLSPHN